MKKIEDESEFDLSIITIANKIDKDLQRCIKSCNFSKIKVEHILIFPEKEKKIALAKFNKKNIYFDKGKGVYNALKPYKKQGKKFYCCMEIIFFQMRALN